MKKQPTQTQLTHKLSSCREVYKTLLDKEGSPVSSFLYSHTPQENKKEKNKFKMDSKNPIMTIKNNTKQ